MKPWQTLDAWLIADGQEVGSPTPGQTEKGKHSPTSAHGKQRGRDYGNGVPHSDCPAIAKALLPFATKDGPIMELFYEGDQVKIWRDNGVDFSPTPDLRRAHRDHVHVALWPGRDMPTHAATQLEDEEMDPNFRVSGISAYGGNGTWVLTRDGGVRAEKGAPFYGAYPGLPEKDRQGDRYFISIEPKGFGYRLIASDGSKYDFGP